MNYHAVSGAASKSLEEKPRAASREESNPTRLESLLLGLCSLNYKRPSGRPSRLTKTQRHELGKLIDAGPEKAGYDEDCWTAVLIQDLIEKRFGVVYHPHYVAELPKHMGFFGIISIIRGKNLAKV